MLGAAAAAVMHAAAVMMAAVAVAVVVATYNRGGTEQLCPRGSGCGECTGAGVRYGIGVDTARGDRLREGQCRRRPCG